MALERFFAVHDIRVADHKTAGLHYVFSAADKILSFAFHNIKEFQHILMLVQQLRVLCVIVFIHKMQIDKLCRRDCGFAAEHEHDLLFCVCV